MATEINPGIDLIDQNSSLYSTYMSLYNMFFNAQDSGTVDSGSDIDIKIKNSAYGFAVVIDNGGSGGGSNEYLLKAGGDLFGILRANYGFEGGIDNHRVLNAFKQAITDELGATVGYRYGLNIDGDLKVGGQNLFIDDKNIIQYNKNTGILSFLPDLSSVFNGGVNFLSDVFIGASDGSGVHIDSLGIKINQNDVYHAGNSNLNTVDWTSKNSNVNGSLQVKLESVLLGSVSALHGFSFGRNGEQYLSAQSDRSVLFNSNINFGVSYGIKVENNPVLMRQGDYNIEFNAIGGDILLGNQSTLKARLMTKFSI